MWKEFDRCLQLHAVDGVELVALFFKSSIQRISEYAIRMGEHTQVLLSLIFRKGCGGLSASPSKQREIKSVC